MDRCPVCSNDDIKTVKTRKGSMQQKKIERHTCKACGHEETTFGDRENYKFKELRPVFGNKHEISRKNERKREN